MGKINAIETHYNGYKFRSRLEARYAVFFDVMEIQYRYEHEGFIVDGEPYLPDFWLPKLSLWAEVKPQSFTDHELSLCEGLVRDTGYGCLLLEDIPSDVEYTVLSPKQAYTMQLAKGAKGLSAIEASRMARFEHGERGILSKIFKPRSNQRNPEIPRTEQMNWIMWHVDEMRRNHWGIGIPAAELGTSVALGFLSWELVRDELLSVAEQMGMSRTDASTIIEEKFQWAENNMPY